jgi:hypothetical protein
MTMRDWVDKLDEFLKASGRKLFEHAFRIRGPVGRIIEQSSSGRPSELPWQC